MLHVYQASLSYIHACTYISSTYASKVADLEWFWFLSYCYCIAFCKRKSHVWTFCWVGCSWVMSRDEHVIESCECNELRTWLLHLVFLYQLLLLPIDLYTTLQTLSKCILYMCNFIFSYNIYKDVCVVPMTIGYVYCILAYSCLYFYRLPHPLLL